MLSVELVADAFGRVKDAVHAVLRGAGREVPVYRPDPGSNTVAWLIWHLTRVQDDHLAELRGAEQVWTGEGWAERFALPFDPTATGYGHSADEVAAVRPDAALLAGYHDAVHARTLDFLATLTEADFARIVDPRWTPPVTLAVRLVSVIEDDLQHVGQAAYLRGLAERAGR